MPRSCRRPLTKRGEARTRKICLTIGPAGAAFQEGVQIKREHPLTTA